MRQDDGQSLEGYGIVGIIGIILWSILDAVKIAKLNNQVWRDNQKKFISLNVEPYFDLNKVNSFGSIGLTFKLTF